MNKSILIIGANGFLGYNFAKRISKYNFKLILLCKKKKKIKLIKNAQYIFCDISNKKEIKKLLNYNFEYVLNFSGNINHADRKQTYQIHYNGFKNIIDILENKKIKLFIQAGSSLEYGNTTSPHQENKICKPDSYYGKAKYLATNYLLNKKVKFKYIVLRLYQVYGPYQKGDRLVPYVINKCLKDKRFNCTEGLQIRDFLYVEDLMALLEKIIFQKKIISGILNVGYGKFFSVRNVIKKINTIIGRGKPIFGAIKMRNDEKIHQYPDISKVKRLIRWRPKTSLMSGLKKTIIYYEKKRKN